ncbi:MAG TPA: T9SS type A sorting domain-containing protein [Cyclobacteriaceae bacterium]|nr:T9SS type A sorting domain-containing protein [Cyclobacteriaceae bacterium]
MKKRLILSVILLTLIVSGIQAQDYWTQLKNFPGYGRASAVAVTIGDKAYVGLGAGGPSGVLNDFWEFDAMTGAWTQKSDFPSVGRWGAIAFAVNGKAYVGTGVTVRTVHNDMYEYNPALNQWTQKSNYPAGPRYTGMTFTIGNKAYAGGGKGSDTYLGTYDFWEYNATNDTWIRRADIGNTNDGYVRRSLGVGFTVDSKGYIGLGAKDYDTRMKDLWEYNPLNDAWTRKHDLPAIERYGASAFVLNNRAYVGGGQYYSPQNDLWEYVPSMDLWIQRASDTSNGRAQGVGFSIANKGYIGFGSAAENLNDIWEYTPTECDTWTQLPNFPDNGRYGAVAVSIGNKGYIGLGAGDEGYINDFWEFDPYTYTWTQKSNFPGSKRQAGVAFAVNDKAYVGTGINMDGVHSDMYEYNPSLNVWTKKADYPGGPRYAAMAFSIGNKGYIGAGKDQNTYSGNYDFWEYDPLIDQWTRKADIGTVERSTGIAFSVGNKGYMGLGFEGYDTRKNDLWEYDQAMNTWTRKADYPGGGQALGFAFSISSRGYVGSGYNGGIHNDFWEYNPESNTWIQKPDPGNTGRGQGIGFSIGNSGYIGFGYNSSTLLNDLWVYTQGTIVDAPTDQKLCYSSTNKYTIPLLSTTSICGIQGISYSITGTTERTGTGNDASGHFNIGNSSIIWNVVDDKGNLLTASTNVFINNPLSVIIPDKYAVNPGGDVNTIYIGYGPTSLTYDAVSTGGTPFDASSYRYLWSTGETTSAITVAPTNPGLYNYVINVTDKSGCIATNSITVNVIDIRCGKNLDKVELCKSPPGNPNKTTVVCINKNAVDSQLKNGSRLSVCSPIASDFLTVDNNVTIFPNPNKGSFNVIITDIVSTWCEVRIIDRNGMTIDTKTVNSTENTKSVQFDIAGGLTGVYFVKLMSSEGVKVYKVMLE